MLQLWEAGAPLTRVLEATTWSCEAPTYEEGKAELRTCWSSNLAGKLMRLAEYR